MSRKTSETDTNFSETVRTRGFVFHVKTKELQNPEGETVSLRSQSAEVLGVLAAHPGETVSRETLIEAVWADTFVTDDSLVQCVADIRRALGDDKHRIIETFPKRGYRLNVDPPGAGDATAADGARSLRRPDRRATAVAAVLVLAIAAGIYYGAKSWRAAPTVSGNMPRIAVLPFEDLSAGEDKGYLSDAIAEGIITELARSKTYAVIARNSSFRYRDQPATIRQIGQELRVDYVLEGSQQKFGNRLKVTAQLIDASDEAHLWANTYDREIADLFVVQDEIIRTLAERVGRRIEAPLPVSDAARVSALHYYLLGLAAIRKEMSAESVEIVRQTSLKAIEVDPDSPFGYINLAWSYRHDAVFGFHQREHSHDEALRLAAEFADKAIALAPDDPDAQYVRARIHTEAGEIEPALARFDLAIALNPSDSSYLAGSTSPLLYIGRTDEAIERIERAKGIDPFYPDWFDWQLGWAYWEKNDCQAALVAMLRMKKIYTAAHRQLAGIYACLGNVQAAKEALAVFLKDSPDHTISKEREEWGNLWTAPGSLDRWIEHMRIAGLPE